MAEAKVVDVLWEASKSGYLKPRVRIEPIALGGVTIEYATGFNAKFIEDNKIGIGAVIQIIRSGDVIPYIKSVTQPAVAPKMPDRTYHWNDTHVDIILDDIESDSTVLEKNITAFFVELEVKGLAKGNIRRLMESGFDSVSKIIRMSAADFETVGFKKLANSFVSSIREKLDKASLTDIMSASNKLGRGISKKTIELIMESDRNILTSDESSEQKIARLIRIDGIGPISAAMFVNHIPGFLAFLKECGLENKMDASTPISSVLDRTSVLDQTHPLFGKHVVMTKVRDADVAKLLEDVGGHLDDAIKTNTDILIVKSKEDTSTKIVKAREKGVRIMTLEEFRGEFI